MRSQGLLASLPADLQTMLLARGEWRRVAPQTPLFLAGDNTGALLGIASGHVAFETALTGTAMTLVEMQRGPLWIGGQPLVDGSMRVVTATARSEVQLISFPMGTMYNLIAQDVRFTPTTLAIAARLFRIALTALSDALIPDSLQRCVATLLRVSGLRIAGDGPVTIPISQTDLSQLCNLSRQTAGDVLRSLAAEGWLLLGYRAVTITAPAQLRGLLDCA